MAYACEAGTWRNIFLSAAFELRHIKQSILKGTPEEFITRSSPSLSTLPPHYAFEYFSVLLGGFKADGVVKTWTVKIGNEMHQLELKNSVLYHKLVTDTEGEIIEFASMKEFSEDYKANMLASAKGGKPHSSMFELYKYFDTFNYARNIIEPLDK